MATCSEAAAAAAAATAAKAACELELSAGAYTCTTETNKTHRSYTHRTTTRKRTPDRQAAGTFKNRGVATLLKSGMNRPSLFLTRLQVPTVYVHVCTTQ